MDRADLSGRRFGRLLVIRELSPSRPRRCLCRCDCGNTVTPTRDNLKNGHTRSCGCLRSDKSVREAIGRARTTHGLTNTHPLYRLWAGIRTRCRNPNATGYDRYGGRGITICAEWDDFPAFVRDVGERPSPQHTLDRINQNGNYEPGNVRWATPEEQAGNRRDNHIVTYLGQPMPLRKVCRVSGTRVSRRTIKRRLERGWPLEDALLPGRRRAPA